MLDNPLNSLIKENYFPLLPLGKTPPKVIITTRPSFTPPAPKKGDHLAALISRRFSFTSGNAVIAAAHSPDIAKDRKRRFHVCNTKEETQSPSLYRRAIDGYLSLLGLISSTMGNQLLSISAPGKLCEMGFFPILDLRVTWHYLYAHPGLLFTILSLLVIIPVWIYIVDRANKK